MTGGVSISPAAQRIVASLKRWGVATAEEIARAETEGERAVVELARRAVMRDDGTGYASTLSLEELIRQWQRSRPSGPPDFAGFEFLLEPLDGVGTGGWHRVQGAGGEIGAGAMHAYAPGETPTTAELARLAGFARREIARAGGVARVLVAPDHPDPSRRIAALEGVTVSACRTRGHAAGGYLGALQAELLRAGAAVDGGARCRITTGPTGVILAHWSPAAPMPGNRGATAEICNPAATLAALRALPTGCGLDAFWDAL